MKRIHIQLEIEPELLPPFYSAASDSPAITELRLVDWNLAAAGTGTVLYAIDGEIDRFRDALYETDGITNVRLANVDRETSYALVEARLNSIALFSTFVELVGRAGLVVRRPVVVRNDKSRARIVGDPATLQTVVDSVPQQFTIEIDRISEFPGVEADPWDRLSDRQAEAVSAALDMGYYESPRETTHAEIATQLDCAPNTVTTHLQKAEAKLLDAILTEGDSLSFGSR